MDSEFWQGVSNVLQIVGSLGFFIYGMKKMSDGIQRAAGSQMRNILRTMTRNRFFGLFTGFLTTALVQSSSATTVMTVSFVNAGLLTLVESAGVMMGANIGTTITGWIVSILGFKVKLSAYSVPLFAIGVPMFLSRRNKLIYWGEFLIGFAILFLGLEFLKDAVPDIKSNPEVLEFLKTFTQWGFFSRLFFVFVGALITIIVQSSSAAMAITLTMCTQGWLTYDVAAAMILGENIGTTITAEIASLVGNVNAKRSARIHSLFNVIGVAWMVVLMPIVLPILSEFVQNVFGIKDPYVSADDMPIALSAFHTTFNLLNVIILIGFVKYLVNFAQWSVPSKGSKDELKRLKFIGSGMRTPELSTVELQKETAHFGEVVSRMAGFTRTLINSTEESVQAEMLDKIQKYERISDEMEIEITRYITTLNKQEITPKTSLRLRSILNICNDLERIGDIYFQISQTLKNKIENRIYFRPKQRKNLNKLMDELDKGFEIMVNNLSAPSYDYVSKEDAQLVEDSINSLKNQFKDENLSNLGREDYNVKSALVYNNVFSSLEKVGDHVINVSEAIVGEI